VPTATEALYEYEPGRRERAGEGATGGSAT
jgi:hypothetical protein